MARQLQLPPPPLTGTIQVTAVPQQIVGQCLTREALILNNVGTVQVFVGNTPEVTPATGFALNANQAFVTNVKWPWYVVSATTGVLSFLDDRH